MRLDGHVVHSNVNVRRVVDPDFESTSHWQVISSVESYPDMSDSYLQKWYGGVTRGGSECAGRENGTVRLLP